MAAAVEEKECLKILSIKARENWGRNQNQLFQISGN